MSDLQHLRVGWRLGKLVCVLHGKLGHVVVGDVVHETCAAMQDALRKKWTDAGNSPELGEREYWEEDFPELRGG